MHITLARVRYFAVLLVLVLTGLWLVAAAFWIFLPSGAPSDDRVLGDLISGKTVTRVFRTASYWPDGALWQAPPSRPGFPGARWPAMRPWKEYFSFSVAVDRDDAGIIDTLIIADNRITLRGPNGTEGTVAWGRCGDSSAVWLPRVSLADTVLLTSVASDSKCGAGLLANATAGIVEVTSDLRNWVLRDGITPATAPPLISVKLPTEDGAQPTITFARGSVSPSAFYRTRFVLLFVLRSPVFIVLVVRFLVRDALPFLASLAGLVLTCAFIVLVATAVYLAVRGRLGRAITAGYTAFVDEARGGPRLTGEEEAGRSLPTGASSSSA